MKYAFIMFSICHVPFPIGTESLSSTIFKILASKYIWVTTLTFQGHVTSPVTWLFKVKVVTQIYLDANIWKTVEDIDSVSMGHQ